MSRQPPSPTAPADAVLVDVVRTPLGTRNGQLSGWHPADLTGFVLRALTERTGIDPALVDDVVVGCVTQVGAQSLDVGRNAVLAAGWPHSVSATTVDRQCASGQQAIHAAAAELCLSPETVREAMQAEGETR